MRIDQLHPMSAVADHPDIPAELRSSVTRHQAHLAALVASLRAAGLREDTIDASVRTLIDSYADELKIAIREMMKVHHDR